MGCVENMHYAYVISAITILSTFRASGECGTVSVTVLKVRISNKKIPCTQVNVFRGACLTGFSPQSTPWPEEYKGPSVWRAACGRSSREWARLRQCCEETQSDEESAAWVLSLRPSNPHAQTSRCTFHIPVWGHFSHPSGNSLCSYVHVIHHILKRALVLVTS